MPFEISNLFSIGRFANTAVVPDWNNSSRTLPVAMAFKACDKERK